MAYSCSDFSDDVLNTLIDIGAVAQAELEDDDPQQQATLTMNAIRGLAAGLDSHVVAVLSAAEVRDELPADPEGQNDDRAEWAAFAIERFREKTGTDREDAVSDLLANLMHWCDRDGISFAAEFKRACQHYTEETMPELIDIN